MFAVEVTVSAGAVRHSDNPFPEASLTIASAERREAAARRHRRGARRAAVLTAGDVEARGRAGGPLPEHASGQ
jgi:hypothetical protein